MASPNSLHRGEEANICAVRYSDAVDPTPAVTSSPPSSSCLNNDLCAFVYDKTGLGWLADTGYYALVKPVRILLIIFAALLLRFVVSRMIRRIIKSASSDRRQGLFHPLRQRMPSSLQDATGLGTQRRTQRAAALGSVLQSIASVTVFSVSTMMVLSELGVDLAPLLASAGIAGIALGFGAQNLVKDFIAGLFMLLEDQYGVGDNVDLGDISGTVEAVVRGAAPARLAEDPAFADDLMEPPKVLGVEQLTVDGAVLRTTAKTASSAQWRVGRELRRRLTEALENAGITDQLAASRVIVRPPQAPDQEPGT
jgi:small-conductance mechanosensitive channel